MSIINHNESEAESCIPYCGCGLRAAPFTNAKCSIITSKHQKACWFWIHLSSWIWDFVRCCNMPRESRTAWVSVLCFTKASAAHFFNSIKSFFPLGRPWSWASTYDMLCRIIAASRQPICPKQVWLPKKNKSWPGLMNVSALILFIYIFVFKVCFVWFLNLDCQKTWQPLQWQQERWHELRRELCFCIRA